MTSDHPLVSVIIPAYKARFLAQTLDSVRCQSWPALELIICDDSQNNAIREIAQEFAKSAGFPVVYSRNETRLGEMGGTSKGIRLAQGEYIKFLHDDDLLASNCIELLVSALQRTPGAAMSTSRRRRIGELGRYLPDTFATVFPFTVSVVVDGPQLVSFLADRSVNFVGEPSCVLCRRGDVLEFADELMMLDNRQITWVGDLAMYVKLLRRGHLVMLIEPLTNFRVSTDQFSNKGLRLPGIGQQGHDDFQRSIHSLGWYLHDQSNHGLVPVAPLEDPTAFQLINLQQLLDTAISVAYRRQQLHAWQRQRTFTRKEAERISQHIAKLQRARLGVLVIPTPCNATRTVVRMNCPADLADQVECTLLGQTLPRHGDLLPLRQANWDPSSPAVALDNALTGWEVDWVIMVSAGSEFTLSGLTHLMIALTEAPEQIHAFYMDEWHRDDAGDLVPIMRSALDMDLLLATPALLARHWIVRRKSIVDVGGYAASAHSALELGLILQLIERHGDTTVNHIPEPLLITAAPSSGEQELHAAAARQHLQARSTKPTQTHTGIASNAAVDSSISIIIVADASTQAAMLERCIVALLERTAHTDYEVVLADNGTNAEVEHWIEQAGALAANKLRTFRFEPALPRTAAMNLAAAQAHGAFLMFTRAEVATLQADWLEHMLIPMQRPGIGIVGARTVSADGIITHAGLLPGLMDRGGRIFSGHSMDSPGYLQRLQTLQRVQAVADSCLLIRAPLFRHLGGFDHAHFADSGADVDLCLRAQLAGYQTIWSPHATFLHAHTIQPYPTAVADALLTRWLAEISQPPMYNPNMRLGMGNGFELTESEFCWKPVPSMASPRILAHPADPWGSGHYRVIQPLQALRREGHAEGVLYGTLLDPVQQARVDPDVVVLQRRISDSDLTSIERMRRYSSAFTVYEVDDYLPNLPLKNLHRRHMPKDVLRSMRRALKIVDRCVVSTSQLAEALQGMHPDIRVVRNLLPTTWWKALPSPASPGSGKPRVGWAGGLGHSGDLELIADVIIELASTVDWVFFGMCPDRLRPYVAEFHPGVDIALYPRALAQLQLDLAIAPLEENRFNECKSNLRLLEYGACAVPVVCSDVGPYRDPCLPVTRVRNRHREWVGAIREHLADADARRLAGDALKSVVHRDWMLEGAGLDEWRAAWLP